MSVGQAFLKCPLSTQVVTDPRDADFFLAHGTEALSLPSGGVEERPLEELKALLCEAAEAAVRVQARPPPLVVANPDVVSMAWSRVDGRTYGFVL